VRTKAGVAFPVNEFTRAQPGDSKHQILSTPVKCNDAIGRVVLKQAELLRIYSAKNLVNCH